MPNFNVKCPKCNQSWTKLMPSGVCFDCESGKTVVVNPNPYIPHPKPTSYIAASVPEEWDGIEPG